MRVAFIAFASLALCGSAHAVDGEIITTQAKALAGGVTSIDNPGFPVDIGLGKYKLGSDLTVPQGAVGIIVHGTNTDIDLNGWGIYGGGKALMGIAGPLNGRNFGPGLASGADVHDGRISGFTYAGVKATKGGTFERLQISRNGVGLFGGGVVSESQFIDNGQGLRATYYDGGHFQVTGNVFLRNSIAIYTENGAAEVLISNNSFFGNNENIVLRQPEYHTVTSGYFSDNVMIGGGCSFVGAEPVGVNVCRPE